MTCDTPSRIAVLLPAESEKSQNATPCLMSTLQTIAFVTSFVTVTFDNESQYSPRNVAKTLF